MANTSSKGQFLKIKAQQREQDVAWMDEQRRRDRDPLEQAKQFLRSRGYMIAPEGRPGEWVCGRRRFLTSPDLIALAERLGCPFQRRIYEEREVEANRRPDRSSRKV